MRTFLTLICAFVATFAYAVQRPEALCKPSAIELARNGRDAAKGIQSYPDVLPIGSERPIYVDLPREVIRVRQLFRMANPRSEATGYVITYFASELRGTPYVAQTLETDGEEHLVVDLDRFDCTTYVETVVALALCMRSFKPDYDDFREMLQRLRYRDGEINGYASRNHYFTEWIDSNTRLGIVEEVKGNAKDRRGAYYPFISVQKLNCNYMSQHPDNYPMMKGKPDVQEQIRANEKKISGRSVRYIPKRLLNRTKKSLSCIQNGDILAIVTNKKGLDTSHLGIAFWDDDDRLHMFHASQIKGEVILDEKPLYNYMNEHPSQLGIRVIRVK